MKIAVVGEIYSSNVGDGVISDTILHLIHQISSEIEVIHIDLSGRTANDVRLLGNSTASSKYAITRTFREFVESTSTLKLIKIHLLWYAFRKRKYEKIWLGSLESADAVIIGGGQLINDNFHDFPLKLDAITSLISNKNKSMVFAYCGAGSKFSRIGGYLLKRSLSRAENLWLRDQASVDRVRNYFELSSELTSDPGLFASTVYSPKLNTEALIGVNIIDYEKVNAYHAGKKRFKTREEYIHLFIDLISLIKSAGYEVEVFTNGEKQDIRFAKVILEQTQQKNDMTFSLAPTPTSPSILMGNISRYKYVIATRLHASILAASHHTPLIGLVWDDKVRAFYKSIGLESFCFDLSDTSSDKIFEGLIRMMTHEFPIDAVSFHKNEVVRAMNEIISLFKESSLE